VSSSAQFLNASEAAKRLGVSAKALRLYEQRGLIAPARTAAGWRAYGPDEMARVAEMAALLGPPPKVIWMRCRNQPTAAIKNLLRSHAATIVGFELDAAAACLEIY